MDDNLAAIIRKESIGQGVGNIFANGLIAWVLLKDRDQLALWALDGVLLDVALTCLLLPLIVAWIVIASQRSKLRKGRLAAIAPDPENRLHRLALKAPQKTGWAALCFGGFGLFGIAPATLLSFQLLGLHTVNPMNYVVFKALWTGALAVGVVVLGVPIAVLRREEAERAAGPATG